MTASIFIITGIMAAGKSTIAQALAERFGRSVHVRGDTFRRFIVNGRAEMNGDSLSAEGVRQLHLRQQIAADVALRYVDAGFTVVMQDILVGNDLSAMVQRLQPHDVRVVVLCPSVDAVAARDRARQLEKGKIAYQPGGIDIAAFDRILRGETPRLGLWLDTSALSVDETVDAILTRLGEARG